MTFQRRPGAANWSAQHPSIAALMSEHFSPSARAPETPQKEADPLNQIITRLNRIHGLNIPVRVNESPSKSKGAGTPERKAYGLMKKLYWQNRSGLEAALRNFEVKARSNASGWLHKPLADRDTLPSRMAGHSYIEASKSPGTLIEALIELLEKVDTAPNSRKSGENKDAKDVVGFTPNPVFYPELPNTELGEGNVDVRKSLYAKTETPVGLGKHEQKDLSASKSIQKASPSRLRNTVLTDYFKAPKGPQSGREPLSLQAPDVVEASSNAEFSDDLSTVEAINLIMQSEEAYIGTDFGSPSKKRRQQNPESAFTARKVSRETFDHSHASEYIANNLNSHTHTTNQFTSLHTSRSVLPSTRPSTTSSAITSKNTSFNSAIVSSGRSPLTSFSSDARPPKPSQIDEQREKAISNNLDHVHINGNDKMDNDDEYTTVGLYGAAKIEHTESVSKEELQVSPYFQQNLVDRSPFADTLPSGNKSLPLRVLYEVTRVSLHASITIPELLLGISQQPTIDLDSYDDFYSRLTTVLIRFNKKAPEKSSRAAWEKAGTTFDCVPLNGELSPTDSGQPVFTFNLRALTLERTSFRFARKFGGDRFLVLQIPELNSKNFPKAKQDEESIRAAIGSWLLNAKHKIFGRTWSPLWVRPVAKKSTSQRGFSVYLFATEGPGIEPTTIEQVLRWHIPIERNETVMALKLFSRLQLAFSTTTPTFEFHPDMIVHTHSAYSDKPGVRRLNVDSKKSSQGCASARHENMKPKVMNDGCARVSRAVAAAIAKDLGLDYIPSAFQGRIAGAKGMWMVDSLDDRLRISSECLSDVWIEICEDQLKFKGHEVDEGLLPDKHRVTFEVSSYSGPLKSSAVNLQFVPILVEQGVHRETLEKLLEDDIKKRTTLLKDAMNNPVALRLWSQQQSTFVSQRGTDGGIQWTGGFPDQKVEQINLLLDSGFLPKECMKLGALCRDQVKQYMERLSEKMHIAVGRSTSAYILADPLDVLKEGEIQLAFSGQFTDPGSGWSETMVQGLDVLVARNPAYMPSDIQKVRAVFKTELALYKDVVIFPSRGKRALADKLSGGDYDGDRVWICWDPAIVSDFRNGTEVEVKEPEYFGIVKEKTRISDIAKQPDFVKRFLRLGFEFNLQSPMVGMCTSYHENYVYKLDRDRRNAGKPSVGNEMSITLAMLLGHLVDSAKGGLIFGEKEWHAFLSKQKLPRQLRKPDYKVGSCPLNGPQDISGHIVDYLVFTVTSKIIDQELRDFSESFAKDARPWDADVGGVWSAEEKYAERHEPGMQDFLKDLNGKVMSLHDWWLGVIPESEKIKPGQTSGFAARAGELRKRFVEIAPMKSDISIASRWLFEANYRSQHKGKDMTVGPLATFGSWNLLKASCLFHRYHKMDKFLWHACGKEIGEIKALRVSDVLTYPHDWLVGNTSAMKEDADYQTGGARLVVRNMHDAMKVDAKIVKKMVAPGPKPAGVEGDGQEGFGGDEDPDEIDTQGWADTFEDDEF